MTTQHSFVTVESFFNEYIYKLVINAADYILNVLHNRCIQKWLDWLRYSLPENSSNW